MGPKMKITAKRRPTVAPIVVQPLTISDSSDSNNESVESELPTVVERAIISDSSSISDEDDDDDDDDDHEKVEHKQEEDEDTEEEDTEEDDVVQASFLPSPSTILAKKVSAMTVNQRTETGSYVYKEPEWGHLGGIRKPYKLMIEQAIREIGDRNGSSYSAIEKWIKVNYPSTKSMSMKPYMHKAIIAGLEEGIFVKAKEQGTWMSRLKCRKTAELPAKPNQKSKANLKPKKPITKRAVVVLADSGYNEDADVQPLKQSKTTKKKTIKEKMTKTEKENKQPRAVKIKTTEPNKSPLKKLAVANEPQQPASASASPTPTPSPKPVRGRPKKAAAKAKVPSPSPPSEENQKKKLTAKRTLRK